MLENPKPAPEYQVRWNNKDADSNSLKKILDWDFEKIIISHGDIIVQRAKETSIRVWNKPLKLLTWRTFRRVIV